MKRRRGSAIVMTMLLLVVLSAVGMYVVSAPLGTVASVSRQHRAAVARNMARAGANAAIARFPLVNPEGSPYVRRIPVGPNVTGRYAVTSRRTGAQDGTGSGGGPVFDEYDLVSAGSVTDLPDGDARVVARIRFVPDRAGPRARILRWEEYGPR